MHKRDLCHSQQCIQTIDATRFFLASEGILVKDFLNQETNRVRSDLHAS